MKVDGFSVRYVKETRALLSSLCLSLFYYLLTAIYQRMSEARVIYPVFIFSIILQSPGRFSSCFMSNWSLGSLSVISIATLILYLFNSFSVLLFFYLCKFITLEKCLVLISLRSENIIYIVREIEIPVRVDYWL